jgi:hypothetical protein
LAEAITPGRLTARRSRPAGRGHIDSVEAVEGVIRDSELGRFRVDQISAEPLPSGHTNRR